VVLDPVALEASWRPPARIASKTRTARMTPIGSIRIPSHLSTLPSGCLGRICRIRGMMTVGPVTVRIAPSSRATWRLRSTNR
jgi:hypothetical protein